MSRKSDICYLGKDRTEFFLCIKVLVGGLGLFAVVCTSAYTYFPHIKAFALGALFSSSLAFTLYFIQEGEKIRRRRSNRMIAEGKNKKGNGSLDLDDSEE